MMGNNEKTKALSVTLPETLHNQFKADCAIRGVSISQAIIEMVKARVLKAELTKRIKNE
jgi:hypothetical protein